MKPKQPERTPQIRGQLRQLLQSCADAPGGALYPAILRGRTFTQARSLLGVLLAVALFLLLTPVITQAVVMIGWVSAGRPAPFTDYYTSALRFERPVGMLGANLGLAFLIVICLALMVVVHRVRPAWLISVQARVRWRYALVCLGIAVIILGSVVAVTLVVSGVRLNPPDIAWLYLVIIMVTSPLQAAAEEVMFRGYMTQALGSLVAQPWFGVVVSALVFALFHGGQNLPLFANRFAFGLLAGVLVVKTGGLEAAVAVHVVNNLLAYTPAVLTGTVAATRGISAISWADASSGIGAFAAFALVAWLVARRTHVLTRVAPIKPLRKPVENSS